ncbi:MAG: aminoacyl-tRNA hydrolase [bacterium]|nr:aminoacyl-tRNA hydrolase [bacterium]
MKTIFGIGNPGQEYKLTRHNVGFQIIDRISSLYRIKMNPAHKLCAGWLCGKGDSDGNPYVLIKPLSFVNECGMVAREVVIRFGLSLSDFLVVLDDFSLPIGKTRLKPNGSSGGHNGLKSIIYHLESEDFPRLRIGIGPVTGSSVDFVLSKFKSSELKLLEATIEKVILSIQVFIKEGINRAMEICNKD